MKTSNVWDECPERRKQWASKWLGRLDEEFQQLLQAHHDQKLALQDKEQDDEEPEDLGDCGQEGQEAEEEEEAEEDQEVVDDDEEQVEAEPQPKKKRMVATVDGGPLVRLRTKTSNESLGSFTTPDKSKEVASSPGSSGGRKTSLGIQKYRSWLQPHNYPTRDTFGIKPF